MTETRKEFEEWYLKEYGNDISEYFINERYLHEMVHMQYMGWQACKSINDKRIGQLLAVIAKKDEALREVIEMYVDDANDADPEESVGAFAKQAISITNDNVRLVPVKWQTYDHDDGEWFTFDTEEEAKEVWPNNNIRRQLYTIVKGAEG